MYLHENYCSIQLKPDDCHQVDSERINGLFAVSLPELTLAWLRIDLSVLPWQDEPSIIYVLKIFFNLLNILHDYCTIRIFG
jgi:hypothetical protein